MAWFTRWFGTPYYVKLYGHRGAQEAGQWVQGIVAHWALPQGSHVLDVACGRGRHTFWFDALGMVVTGVDMDEASIREARMRVPQARFIVHDMREPLSTSGFDAAACLFTSLGYSGHPDDDRAMLRSVAGALVPGGLFTLDFMNGPKVAREIVRHEVRTVDGVTFHLHRRMDGPILVKEIEVRDAGVVHHFEERVRAWSPEELDGLLGDAGFSIMDRTGGPPFAQFDPRSSDRYVAWCRRQA
jgi:SAM-dependent methyltransferase